MAEIGVREGLCDLCGTCVAVCPADCIELSETTLSVDMEKCILCEFCLKICPVDALELRDGQPV